MDKIEGTITCGLRTQDRASPLHALTRQGSAMELTGNSLILSEEVADFTGTYADVAGRYVHIRTDNFVKLCHKRLAELHHLVVTLASDREIGTAFTTTHRQCGQCILEGLLETKELQNTQIDGCVETQATLIRANGTIKLDAIAKIDLYLALIVNPGHTECRNTLGFYDTFHNLCLLEFGVLVVHVLNGFQHLAHCLQELYFTWMFTLQILHNFLNFHSKSL